MNDKDRKRASKFLSLVLRHDPRAAGITLDDAGWVGVTELLAGLEGAGRGLSRAQLQEIVRTSDKQRFALSPDGSRIRANQGHSVDVELRHAPAEPPPTLLHGTSTRWLDAILARGLKSMKRHHVHLSADIDTARKVGMRHGKLVMLEVDAAAMRADGFEFFLTPNGVWLVDHVPPRFVSVRSD